MKNKLIRICSVITALLVLTFSAVGCQQTDTKPQSSTTAAQTDDYTYTKKDFSFKRNGVKLHLDRTVLNGNKSDKQILLTHGVTYSSHEFDVDYKDYSLVRFLSREGYAVWKLDIAGFGQSGEVKDGYTPDSDYAAEDINAAVEKIVKESGQDKIDILGWSWGTVTAGRYAAKHSEHLNKLVLYAPILSGIGEYEVNEDFHHNTWEHAADDFQRDKNGGFDYDITEPEMIEMFCSSCWHYDGEYSPNGGRCDICVNKDKKLIDLSKIKAPTLIICGDNDPYLNYELVDSAKDFLPNGSVTKKISGGAHVIMYEKPYYHKFQNAIKEFLI